MEEIVKRFKGAAKIIALCAIMVSVVSCKGTETGNPGVPSDHEGGRGPCLVVGSASSVKDATGDDQVLDDLLLAFCQRIVTCGVATTIDQCFTALEGEDGDPMTDELGLPTGTIMNQVRSLLIQGKVVSDATQADACETDIGLVDCATVTAQVSVSDFSATEHFVPISCDSVFLLSDDSSAPNPTDGGCP